MAWQKASSQKNIRPQKKFNMIKLKKKNQKNREKLKNAISSHSYKRN